MVEYKEERLHDCLDDIKPLLESHYDELSVTKGYPLSPNYEVYLKMQELGSLVVVTARDKGTLVGYIIFIVSPHLHYTTCKTAMDDIYFIKKEYRTGRTGLRLFQEAEKVLKSHDVSRILLSCKVHLDHSRLFKHLGYKHIEYVFDKLI